MFEDKIKELISKSTSLKKQEIVLEKPKQNFGDYAFPCFILAKKLKKSPVEIAKEIKNKIKLAKGIEKVENVGGYLNFFIDKKGFAEAILKNLTKPKPRKKRIVLEHTSVNPNASPHVGRARNSVIGDSIKRILEFQGYNVETHYYVNNVSKQIAMLALVFRQRDGFNNLLKKYIEISKKVKNDPKLERKVFDLLNKFERGDKKTVAKFNRIVKTAISGQKKIFKDIGIKFNYFDYESTYIEPAKKIIKELQKTGKVIKDEEGRLILDQKGTGLDKKMRCPVLVLTRSDGTGLYILRDLAYTLEKIKKGENIIVLGEDQKLYFEQLKQALILMKKDYPKVVHYSFVLLKHVGKMSTRKGDVVLLEDFLDKVYEKAKQEVRKRGTKGNPRRIAIAAIKYSMLKNDNNRSIIFDLDEALRFEGDTGPYLLYSYARASSILRKVKKKVGATRIKNLKEEEIKMIKKIGEFSEVVEKAHQQFAPNLIANYSYELASIFNEFYHSCPVIGSKEESQRLAIVKATRETLRNALKLLGIDTLEEM
ncbi:MAG: arginine--tRNA ligase [archaeon]|nr:MAG: arginine--tRNA ligase [archaeon]